MPCMKSFRSPAKLPLSSPHAASLYSKPAIHLCQICMETITKDCIPIGVLPKRRYIPWTTKWIRSAIHKWNLLYQNHRFLVTSTLLPEAPFVTMLRSEKHSNIQGLRNGESYSTIPKINSGKQLTPTFPKLTYKKDSSAFFHIESSLLKYNYCWMGKESCHAIKELLVALAKYLMKWVASYLTGRKTKAVVNCICSNFSLAIFSMTQGSV